MVIYQSPGRIDWGVLESGGVGMDALIRHFLFTQEFLWRVLDPREEAKCITVLDVTGVKVSAGLGSSSSSKDQNMEFLKAMLVILGEVRTTHVDRG